MYGLLPHPLFVAPCGGSTGLYCHLYGHAMQQLGNVAWHPVSTIVCGLGVCVIWRLGELPTQDFVLLVFGGESTIEETRVGSMVPLPWRSFFEPTKLIKAKKAHQPHLKHRQLYGFVRVSSECFSTQATCVDSNLVFALEKTSSHNINTFLPYTQSFLISSFIAVPRLLLIDYHKPKV